MVIASRQRVCILSGGMLGDTALLLPTLPALRQLYPQSEFSMIVDNRWLDIVSGNPSLSRWFGSPELASDAWPAFLTELSKLDFDVTLAFTANPRAEAMMRAIRAKCRVVSRWWRVSCARVATVAESDKFWTHELGDGTEWPASFYAGCRDVLLSHGCASAAFKAEFDIPAEALRFARRHTAIKPTLILHVSASAVSTGSGDDNKFWPAARFAEIVRRAVTCYAVKVLFVGDAYAQRQTAAVRAHLGDLAVSDVVVDLTGRTTVKQLLGLLRLARVVVSNDSGPMHLAAVLGTPTLGIFTSTSSFWRPWPGPYVSVVGDRDSPPDRTLARQPPSVDTVWAALELLMRTSATL